MSDGARRRGVWWRRETPPVKAGAMNVGRTERVVSAVAGGTLLLIGSMGRGWVRRLLAVAGGALVLRAVTGRSRVYRMAGVSSAGLGEGAGIGIEEAMTIDAPVHEVYRHWADVKALPAFLTHVVAVEDMGGGRSHWVLDTPSDDPFTFDTRVIDQREDRMLSWRTTPDSEIEHAGSVRFAQAPAGHGTEVRLKLRYVPPGGVAGFAAARAASGVLQRTIADEMRHMRETLEAGASGTAAPISGRSSREPVTVATAPSLGEAGAGLPLDEV